MPRLNYQFTMKLEGPLFLEITPETEGVDLSNFTGVARSGFDEPFIFQSSTELSILVTPFVSEKEISDAGIFAPFEAIARVSFEESDPVSLVDAFEPILEEMLDYLSYLWDYPIKCYDIEVFEIREEHTSGDQCCFTRIVNYQTPKFRETRFPHNHSFKAENIRAYHELTEPSRAALRWYNISLTPQPDAQKFVALWIALEILVRARSKTIKLPYRASCGHDIHTCPICEASTIRDVSGEQIREFLIQQAGLNPDQARALWKTRQLVHGRNRLRRDDVRDLPDRIAELLLTVKRLLASELGLEFVNEPCKPMGLQGTVISGHRSIHARDLDPTLRTFPKRTSPARRVVMMRDPMPGRGKVPGRADGHSSAV